MECAGSLPSPFAGGCARRLILGNRARRLKASRRNRFRARRLRSSHSHPEWQPSSLGIRGMIRAGIAYLVHRRRECHVPPFAETARRSRHRSRRSGMSPGTAFHLFHRAGPAEGSGNAWALVIAILFAVVAAASFAVDQSVTLSNFPVPPAQTGGRRFPGGGRT